MNKRELRRDHWQKTAQLILLKVGKCIWKNPIIFIAKRKRGVASHFWACKMYVKMLIWLAQSQCYGIGRKKLIWGGQGSLWNFLIGTEEKFALNLVIWAHQYQKCKEYFHKAVWTDQSAKESSMRGLTNSYIHKSNIIWYGMRVMHACLAKKITLYCSDSFPGPKNVKDKANGHRMYL
jgi:hypothetical protein